MSEYKTTVGIEVHAELKTTSKMFCGCTNNPHAAEANANICPVCMAHPGTLPVVNQDAVKKVLQVGTAIGADLATFSEFDRKNYFYPDIPKAYQISQYQFPFVKGGEIAGVAITRIHLEEDTARSQHDQGEGSLVDFNRAGVPLMELVTEPVIHDAKTAGAFARELQLLLRTLGVSDANMERGEMRVEANISVSKTEHLGTKVEVKNLNSFKVMEAAIDFEVSRQIKALEAGETLIQETRGWDEAKGQTYSQRSKESADEYRYFPDPDIPKYDLSKISEFNKTSLSEIMPILPNEMRILYRDLGLNEKQIEVIINDNKLREYFSVVVAEVAGDAKIASLAANYTASDIAGLLQKDSTLELKIVSTGSFIALMRMVNENTLNSRGAKDLLHDVVFANIDPQNEAEKRGILQKNNTEEILPIVQQVIADNPEVAAEFKGGKEASLKFLVGQGMKLSKGAANPQTLETLLKSELS